MSRLIIVLISLWCLGCVQRTLVIDSQPQGALVYVNDQEVGRTPCEVEFLFYGTYDVRLEKQGCHTLWTVGEAKMPWWDAPVVDILVAPFGPYERRVEWHFNLPPAPESQGDFTELLERTREMQDLNRLPDDQVLAEKEK